MTDENRRANLRDVLADGERALHAAAVLLNAGIFQDAVSRAYYAAFHHVEAVLFSRGLQARSHHGTHHVLREQFVRPGLLPERVHELLVKVFELRMSADYRRGPVCDEESARARIAQAQEVCGTIRAFLEAEGWLADPESRQGE